MIIAGKYSFNKGLEIIQRDYKNLLKEISHIIGTIDAGKCKKKKSLEKTMPGRLLYSPKDLNSAFKREFEQAGWQKQKVNCKYSNAFYEKNYKAKSMNSGAFREMDFLKNNLGVEVQFGKYAFMVYNVCAKMTIFHNLGYINAGIEIVPVKKFADEMSTGVSYFEQFVWDLQHRGVSNIDIPVLILGIDKSK